MADAAQRPVDVRFATDLLSIHDACTIAKSYVSPMTDIVTRPLSVARGRILAMDLDAEVAVPPFTQSAMDGYAVAAGSGLACGTTLVLHGRVAAGGTAGRLPLGAATQLFTGAPIPLCADAVIMQENVTRVGDRIRLNKPVRAGDNVRYRGEDIDPPERLLQRGIRIDARHIGLMAAQGIAAIPVLRPVRVAVVSTGDELLQSGEPLKPACIYDSNRPMLLALIEQAGLDAIDGGWVPDCPAKQAARLADLSNSADLVITTGGASVGEADHAASALSLSGGHGRTLKIALKPGKPAVVGRIGCAAFLGLPGNPVSSLVSWMILGQAMVAAAEGRDATRVPGRLMRSISSFARSLGRTEFVPARLSPTADGYGVEILGKGGSARLRPLADADGLVEIDPASDGVSPGDTVQFHPFKDGLMQ